MALIVILHNDQATIYSKIASIHTLDSISNVYTMSIVHNYSCKQRVWGEAACHIDLAQRHMHTNLAGAAPTQKYVIEY